MSRCRYRDWGSRGAAAFEVALSLALAALLLIPTSLIIARFSATLRENGLSLEGSALLQTWLDELETWGIEEGCASEDVRFGKSRWRLECDTQDPYASIELGSTIEGGVLTLLVASARNDDRSVEVKAYRLMLMPDRARARSAALQSERS
jgi:hypothetical protein